MAGDYLVTRATDAGAAYRDLTISFPELVGIRHVDEYTSSNRRERFNEIYVRTDKGRRRRLSDGARAVLEQADGSTRVGELLEVSGLAASCQESVLRELQDLWTRRLVDFRPAARQE